jgi:hypothetical protein
VSDGETTATTTFIVLWRDPLVCVISAGWGSSWGAMMALEIANGRECHIVARLTNRVDIVAPDIAGLAERLKREAPNATLWSLVSSPADAAAVETLGVGAIWATPTAFVDERIYYPELEQPKLYAAVHTARTDAMKRHELAHGVSNLALISYPAFGDSEPVGDVAARYRSLGYVNWSEATGARFLDPPGVRRLVSQSRCGLVLSAVEGANNASVEYFLCGIPLVTTPSQGGRDVMYDALHVTIVEPTAAAVEAAVAAYQASAPDPLDIRAAALARARPHRQRLIAWLSERAGRDLAMLADGNLWLPQFYDKLRQTWLIETRPDGGWQARRYQTPGFTQ